MPVVEAAAEAAPENVAEASSAEGPAKEEPEEFREHEWMFRPCDMYKDEYDDCKSIRARFHQYFIFGETLDCNQWNTDYSNCYYWTKYRSEDAYQQLAESEKKRRYERLKGHYQNTVWEKRDKPPENWNAPLPDWLQEEYNSSFLHQLNEQLKAGKDVLPNASCTIL